MQTPPPRIPVLNIIRLEFTGTKLNTNVEPPSVVLELSWVDRFFRLTEVRPKVQKYVLMSAQDSYTDFHIDFSETSVWYHIFEVSERSINYLLLVPPTIYNLEKYKEWINSDEQYEKFLGAERHCDKLELNQGETILAPSGW
ncbi:lysine-specific demethylase 7B-like [Paramacrobiotus metropolitanus]|uniref:lysine-specific demethylase 7B-like n=1 Tax=Paramacrobiotus metropolitanus TaxID=2943436 RepID=UPI0024456351|nr:lysine-specific demethylase 7B-like [Paramacrobiotus metropolitanus]